MQKLWILVVNENFGKKMLAYPGLAQNIANIRYILLLANKKFCKFLNKKFPAI